MRVHSQRLETGKLFTKTSEKRAQRIEISEMKIAIARFYFKDKVPLKPELQSLSSAKKKLTTYLCNDPKSIEVSLERQKK